MDFTPSATLAELLQKTREFISARISFGSGLIHNSLIAPRFGVRSSLACAPALAKHRAAYRQSAR